MYKTATNSVIKCSECEYEFGEDEADVCQRCHSHICPKCYRCGCIYKDRVNNRFVPKGDKGIEYDI